MEVKMLGSVAVVTFTGTVHEMNELYYLLKRCHNLLTIDDSKWGRLVAVFVP